MKYPKNRDIASALDRIAELLEVQGANRFRVDAYRHAARRIVAQEEDVAVQIISKKDDNLEGLPDIGKRIAGIIREFVISGRIGLLDRLEGEIDPEGILMTVPNIGPKLASRIHRELDIETLEELEMNAISGALESVQGIGSKKAEAIRDSVGALLNQSSRRRMFMDHGAMVSSISASQQTSRGAPSVEVVLSVDAEYRRKAEKGQLKMIAPRRLNPGGKPWLPILHTEQEGWDFTAIYSNTARAHELERVKDWVVIYGSRNGDETRNTVVTEHRGSLSGCRVVRGRELECMRYYNRKAQPSGSSRIQKPC